MKKGLSAIMILIEYRKSGDLSFFTLGVCVQVYGSTQR